MAGASTVERLRHYLRELTPQARALLIGELERSLLRGDDARRRRSGAAGIAPASSRDQREGAPRVGNARGCSSSRSSPSWSTTRAEHNHPGRIARSSLEPLWTWVRRDLLPEEAQGARRRRQRRAARRRRAEGRTSGARVSGSCRRGDRRAAAATRDDDDKIAPPRCWRRSARRAPRKMSRRLQCVLDATRRARDARRASAAADRQSGRCTRLDECKALIEKTVAPDGDAFPLRAARR